MTRSPITATHFALVLVATTVVACSEAPDGVSPTSDAGHDVATVPAPGTDAARGSPDAADAPFDAAVPDVSRGDSDGAGGSDAADVSAADGSTDGRPDVSSGPDAISDGGAPDASRADGASVGTIPDGGSDGAVQCVQQTRPCEASGAAACCAGVTCGTTSLGQVCCGMTGGRCATSNGEDCCGDLLCLSGFCGHRLPAPACASPCTMPPALTIERQRLQAIGGSFLGICGDANHTSGYHVAAARLPASDYSMRGEANRPVCNWHAAAIDIGMNWPASRTWLRWLIAEIIAGRIKNVPEVIGSYNGVDVRYWSDSAGWTTNGIAYTGQGHDTWTHVSIYRSTALEDHHILDGWSANGRL